MCRREVPVNSHQGALSSERLTVSKLVQASIAQSCSLPRCAAFGHFNPMSPVVISSVSMPAFNSWPEQRKRRNGPSGVQRKLWLSQIGYLMWIDRCLVSLILLATQVKSSGR